MYYMYVYMYSIKKVIHQSQTRRASAWAAAGQPKPNDVKRDDDGFHIASGGEGGDGGWGLTGGGG